MGPPVISDENYFVVVESILEDGGAMMKDDASTDTFLSQLTFNFSLSSSLASDHTCEYPISAASKLLLLSHSTTTTSVVSDANNHCYNKADGLSKFLSDHSRSRHFLGQKQPLQQPQKTTLQQPSVLLPVVVNPSSHTNCYSSISDTNYGSIINNNNNNTNNNNSKSKTCSGTVHDDCSISDFMTPAFLSRRSGSNKNHLHHRDLPCSSNEDTASRVPSLYSDDETNEHQDWPIPVKSLYADDDEEEGDDDKDEYDDGTEHAVNTTPSVTMTNLFDENHSSSSNNNNKDEKEGEEEPATCLYDDDDDDDDDNDLNIWQDQLFQAIPAKEQRQPMKEMQLPPSKQQHQEDAGAVAVAVAVTSLINVVDPVDLETGATRSHHKPPPVKSYYDSDDHDHDDDNINIKKQETPITTMTKTPERTCRSKLPKMHPSGPPVQQALAQAQPLPAQQSSQLPPSTLLPINTNFNMSSSSPSATAAAAGGGTSNLLLAHDNKSRPRRQRSRNRTTRTSLPKGLPPPPPHSPVPCSAPANEQVQQPEQHETTTTTREPKKRQANNHARKTSQSQSCTQTCSTSQRQQQQQQEASKSISSDSAATCPAAPSASAEIIMMSPTSPSPTSSLPTAADSQRVCFKLAHKNKKNKNSKSGTRTRTATTPTKQEATTATLVMEEQPLLGTEKRLEALTTATSTTTTTTIKDIVAASSSSLLSSSLLSSKQPQQDHAVSQSLENKRRGALRKKRILSATNDPEEKEETKQLSTPAEPTTTRKTTKEVLSSSSRNGSRHRRGHSTSKSQGSSSGAGNDKNSNKKESSSLSPLSSSRRHRSNGKSRKGGNGNNSHHKEEDSKEIQLPVVAVQQQPATLKETRMDCDNTNNASHSFTPNDNAALMAPTPESHKRHSSGSSSSKNSSRSTRSRSRSYSGRHHRRRGRSSSKSQRSASITTGCTGAISCDGRSNSTISLLAQVQECKQEQQELAQRPLQQQHKKQQPPSRLLSPKSNNNVESSSSSSSLDLFGSSTLSSFWPLPSQHQSPQERLLTAFQWYNRLGRPPREQFKQRLEQLADNAAAGTCSAGLILGFDMDDIDALPWAEGGTWVDPVHNSTALLMHTLAVSPNISNSAATYPSSDCHSLLRWSPNSCFNKYHSLVQAGNQTKLVQKVKKKETKC